ncbi:MAG: hypothetical protein E6Q97_34660 [Desulfurellales bacterium]|nr:MAG: hypothetical protein E6Q97_34660 [Desulfurellales bacterium]
MAQTISCEQFAQYIARQTEHLDELMLRDITPVDTLIGAIETGRFAAEDGVSHTFDKIRRVFPDLSTEWDDVTNTGCIGTPCDPSETKIGLGSDRSSYRLQQKSYASDIICYDMSLTADRAKQVFAGYVEMLKMATNIISSNRIQNEYFRNAGNAWVCTTSGLTPFTFTATGDLINVTVKNSSNQTIVPNSGLAVNHLRRRTQYQVMSGALGERVKDMPPLIEFQTDMDTVYDLEHQASLLPSYRFTAWDAASEQYYKFGWMGQMGNFALKAYLWPMRFQILGDNTLRRVFPYKNTTATLGIKGIVNDDYLNAPVQASFIWHRRALRSLMLDNSSLNPNMPFAARDFAGKWQFVMDNLTCGTALSADGQTIPVAVDNSRRNKGKFIADWKWATQAQFPEYAEVFLHLRAQPCVVGSSPCGLDTRYPTQTYSSANDLCS